MNKIVMIRARFVGQPSEEERAKGWYNNVFYDIKIKQDGEKFLVKIAEDENKPSTTLLTLVDFHEFSERFTIHYKYIR